MSPAATGRLERRRCKRAASRLRVTTLTRRPIAIVTTVAAMLVAGLVGPSIVGAASASIDRAAASERGGFEQAQRLDPPPPRPTAPPITNPPATVPPGTAADVQAVLDLTNAERAARGVAPLALHPQLMEAAEMHFRDQFRQGCSNLSHDGTDGSSPFDRIRRTGLRYRNAAENIACGYRTPDAVMNGWMTSSGHRRNILNGNLTHIGIVAAPDAFGRMYWVQVFATPS